MYTSRFKTDLCDMILIGDEDGLTRLHLVVEDTNRDLILDPTLVKNDDFFADAIEQLQAYASGRLKSFDLKLNPKGTDYQKKIWEALRAIPYGHCVSYKDIALATGNEKASRAVGMANGKNPLPIIVPCHRVIGSSGKLTGFAFGLDIKKKMIDLEKSNI